MAVSGLKGSFPFTAEMIEEEIKHNAPGVFTLGNLDARRFKTLYIGRADTNLKQALMKRLNQTTHFKYEQYDDVETAFKKECDLFHLFKPKANLHPQRPPNRDWRCPACDFYK